MKISNHVVIINWNNRASEIVNDLLYSDEDEVVVVLVNSDREKTELEIDDINSKLTTSDYEELMELTAKLDRKTQYRDILYTEWEELSERLTEAEE